MAEEYIGLTPDGKNEIWRDQASGAISYKTPQDDGEDANPSEAAKRIAGDVGPKTEFEQRVEATRAEGGSSRLNDSADVSLLLHNADVSDLKIQEIQANPSNVALIKAHPELVERLAAQFPASYAISYYDQRSQMGFGDIAQADTLTSGGADALAHTAASQATSTSPTGAIEYPGGVLVDPATGVITYPPNNPSLLGSPAWIASVPTWSESKMASWTQTLKQMGYIESKKVDLKTFTDALREYHNNRYLYGGGKAVDLSQGQQGISRQDFGGILDPSVVDTEIRPWFQETYGDDPSDAELEGLRKVITKTAMRLARHKDMAPADAASVASARAQEKFLDDPATQKWKDLQETDTSLHDSFVNLFQVLSS
jgi:hypothetical protein